MVRLGDINPSVWDDAYPNMVSQFMQYQASPADYVLPDWRIYVGKNMMERLLQEKYGKYGFLQTIILNPYFQIVKHWYEQHVSYDAIVGPFYMPLPSVLVLFALCYRQLPLDVLLLGSALLLQINPIYVVGLLLLWSCILKPSSSHDQEDIKNTRLGPRSSISVEGTITQETTENPGKDIVHQEGWFDHILIGNDLSTLFAAALLTRSGQSCCVLQPLMGIVSTTVSGRASPSACRAQLTSNSHCSIHPEGSPCAVSLVDAAFGRVMRYNRLLSVLDKPGGIATSPPFHPIGKASTGYTHTVIRKWGLEDKDSGGGGVRSDIWKIRAGQVR